ncbi:MAG: putative DNA modification/repair radical SAM protein [Lachnospiraceae bacterium]|nr:putative DNA modification/repair radical SAM protein [Lachnospiraceae bacterium]
MEQVSTALEINTTNLTVKNALSLQDKLQILADAAKYDVACTSSGVERKGKEGFLGNSKACGICHSFASDGRCISLLKILMTNHCVYDCKYCINRKSNDVVRATFTPDEICQLTIEFYKRNYIEGLFLSSGVLHNPTYTMERLCETLQLLRTKYHFNGYIHVKTIPGAPDELLAAAGYLADRISINLELPTAESLQKLAPNKNFNTILKPMGKVSSTIAKHRLAIGKDARMERSLTNRYLERNIFQNAMVETKREGEDSSLTQIATNDLSQALAVPGMNLKRAFAPAGQSTQMIIGASGESDFNLIKTTQKLYQSYDLKRVFFSAYIPLNEDAALPEIGTPPPLLREHRLYQADWLLRFYGFEADELLSEEKPNFNELIDPKCDWALRHLELFPVEIQTASYDMILRIPGVGPKSAGRIMKARRYGSLSFEDLKKMGVVLKRAHYFITCGGKMMYKIPIEERFILRQLTATNQKENWQVTHQNSFRQMSLFDDFALQS